MTHTAPRTTPPAPGAPPERPRHPGPLPSPHLARCGSCGEWLHVDEDELIASLDESLLCWNCGVTPGDGRAPV